MRLAFGQLFQLASTTSYNEFMFVQADCCMDQHGCCLHSYLKIRVTKWRHDLRFGAKMFSGAVKDYEGFWGATSVPIRCLCC